VKPAALHVALSVLCLIRFIHRSALRHGSPDQAQLNELDDALGGEPGPAALGVIVDMSKAD
jgi:hypothetical protein